MKEQKRTKQCNDQKCIYYKYIQSHRFGLLHKIAQLQLNNIHTNFVCIHKRKEKHKHIPYFYTWRETDSKKKQRFRYGERKISKKNRGRANEELCNFSNRKRIDFNKSLWLAKYLPQYHSVIFSVKYHLELRYIHTHTASLHPSTQLIDENVLSPKLNYYRIYLYIKKSVSSVPTT